MLRITTKPPTGHCHYPILVEYAIFFFFSTYLILYLMDSKWHVRLRGLRGMKPNLQDALVSKSIVYSKHRNSLNILLKVSEDQFEASKIVWNFLGFFWVEKYSYKYSFLSMPSLKCR